MDVAGETPPIGLAHLQNSVWNLSVLSRPNTLEGCTGEP